MPKVFALSILSLFVCSGAFATTYYTKAPDWEIYTTNTNGDLSGDVSLSGSYTVNGIDIITNGKINADKLKGVIKSLQGKKTISANKVTQCDASLGQYDIGFEQCADIRTDSTNYAPINTGASQELENLLTEGVTWAVKFDYGTVTGTDVCNNYTGMNPVTIGVSAMAMADVQMEDDTTPITTTWDFEPQSETGSGCWCKMTYPDESQWLFVWATNVPSICTNGAAQKSGSCAAACASAVARREAVRSTMFASIKETSTSPQSCPENQAFDGKECRECLSYSYTEKGSNANYCTICPNSNGYAHYDSTKHCMIDECFEGYELKNNECTECENYGTLGIRKLIPNTCDIERCWAGYVLKEGKCTKDEISYEIIEQLRQIRYNPGQSVSFSPYKCRVDSEEIDCENEAFTDMKSGDWKVMESEKPNNKVEGRALCSATSGETGKTGTPIDFPGKFCWCQITSPKVSNWVLYRHDVYSTSSKCEQNCTEWCMNVLKTTMSDTMNEEDLFSGFTEEPTDKDQCTKNAFKYYAPVDDRTCEYTCDEAEIDDKFLCVCKKTTENCPDN